MGIMTFPLSKQREGWLPWYFISFQQYFSAMVCCIGQAVIEPWTLSPTVGSSNSLVTSITRGPTTLSFCGWEYSYLEFCLKVFVFSTLIAYGVWMTTKVFKLLIQFQSQRSMSSILKPVLQLVMQTSFIF